MVLDTSVEVKEVEGDLGSIKISIVDRYLMTLFSVVVLRIRATWSRNHSYRL